MPQELTELEQKFFDTGEVPEGLAAEVGVPVPTPEPEPSPAPAPAPEDATPAPAPAPAPEIDHAAELRAQLESTRRHQAQLEANLRHLSEQIGKPPAPPPETPPDPTTDPLGSMMYQMKQMSATVTALQQQLQQSEQAQTNQSQFSEFAATLQQHRSEFVKQQPDFPDAYAHLRQQRIADLRDAGVPEQQIPHVMLQDEIAVSSNALSQGKNPAQVIYNMAKRYGYTAKAQAPAPGPAPAEKIANLQRGVDAGIAPPRGGRESDLTLDGLKDAGDEDLSRIAQDERAWSKLFGGGSDIFGH